MKKERIFWGMFFIVSAVFLIVSRMGMLGDISVFSILLTVFFVACLIKSIAHRSITGVLFSAAFLCIVYAKPLGIEAVTPWPVLGAALLGSIGCSFLFHPKKRFYNYEGTHHMGMEESIETVDGAQMEFSSTFSGSIKYVNSDDFQSANLHCSFGSLKVYFDNAVIQKGEAVLNLDVAFAGVELYIPKDWTVVNKVNAAFGGIDEKNRNYSTGAPVVRLCGKVSFGGVEIIYV